MFASRNDTGLVALRASALVFGLYFLPAIATALAQPLTGDMRGNFVNSGVNSCADATKKELSDNPNFIKKGGLSLDRVILFCHCKMNYLADMITPDEFTAMLVGEHPASIIEMVPTVQKACLPLLKTMSR